VGRQDVRRIIASLRDRGVSVFLNSHLLTEVERICDRVAIVDHGRVVAQLAMADLQREQGTRIRVSGIDGLAEHVATRYGPARVEGEWLNVDTIAEADVPALVRDLVERGGAVHAVVPMRHSLEERFMSLLGVDAADAAEAPGAAVAGDAAEPVSTDLKATR
jgi:ABC-2 type transport system ATP-binding protein